MMRKFEPSLQLIALLGGAITFGTAYYLLFLAHPVWSAVDFSSFLPVFQEAILKIGMSQLVISNIALVCCVVLFFLSRDWFWLFAVALLLVSLPVTMLFLMPINFAFIEATDPNLAENSSLMLGDWGRFQIIRFICDGLAFAAMCKPIIWPKPRAAASKESSTT